MLIIFRPLFNYFIYKEVSKLSIKCVLAAVVIAARFLPCLAPLTCLFLHIDKMLNPSLKLECNPTVISPANKANKRLIVYM